MDRISAFDDLVKRADGHDDHELVAALEPDQTVAASSRPFPRYRMSRAANAAFWAVRVFVLLIAAMVVYTFFASLS